jgi:hypothetical protein
MRSYDAGVSRTRQSCCAGDDRAGRRRQPPADQGRARAALFATSGAPTSLAASGARARSVRRRRRSSSAARRSTRSHAAGRRDGGATDRDASRSSTPVTEAARGFDSAAARAQGRPDPRQWLAHRRRGRAIAMVHGGPFPATSDRADHLGRRGRDRPLPAPGLLSGPPRCASASGGAARRQSAWPAPLCELSSQPASRKLGLGALTCERTMAMKSSCSRVGSQPARVVTPMAGAGPMGPQGMAARRPSS